MTMLTREQFETHILPHIDGEVYCLNSPNLRYMSRMSSVSLSNDDNKKHDLIIGDFDEHSVHPQATIQSPSFILFVRQAFDKMLSDSGKIVMKLPLKFIRCAQEVCKKGPTYIRFNITHLHILDDHLYAVIDKGQYKDTVVSYQSGESFTCNIHETHLPSKYSEKYKSLIDSYFKNVNLKDYDNMTVINGQQIKKGVQNELKYTIINSQKYGLVMSINQKKVHFSKLEDSRLTSSSVIVTFSDINVRDNYLSALSKKSVSELQLSLSYGGTIPQRIVPMIFHPSILSYA